MIDNGDKKKYVDSNIKLVWNKPEILVLTSDETWGGMGNSSENCGAWS